jgi:hypothetical protein
MVQIFFTLLANTREVMWFLLLQEKGRFSPTKKPLKCWFCYRKNHFSTQQWYIKILFFVKNQILRWKF